LLLIPSLSKTIKNKLMKENPLTVAEVTSMTMSLAVGLPDTGAKKNRCTAADCWPLEGSARRGNHGEG
tara:strand:+ start:1542 stop:1745 length:204 start_codon:yes stop_codon:yes gene_type:complete